MLCWFHVNSKVIIEDLVFSGAGLLTDKLGVPFDFGGGLGHHVGGFVPGCSGIELD